MQVLGYLGLLLSLLSLLLIGDSLHNVDGLNQNFTETFALTAFDKLNQVGVPKPRIFNKITKLLHGQKG